MKKLRLLFASLFTLLAWNGVFARTIEADITAQVGINPGTNWVGASGWCATQFAPAIVTKDGRTAQMAENYQANVDATGDIITQTITGLVNGTYRVTIYGNAFYTSGRGFESDVEDGAEDVCYLFAGSGGNRVQKFIPAHIATSTTENSMITLENVEVTDGTLVIGLGKAKAGTNWHTVQVYEVTVIADFNELADAAVADYEAMNGQAMEAAVAEAMTIAKAAFDAEDSDDNLRAFQAAVAAAKASVEAYAGAAEKLEAMQALVDATNFYTPEAYDEYYGTPKAKYDERTLTSAEANALQNPNLTTGWHAALTVDNFLLSVWDAEPDFASNYYINSWSVEGDNDGTNFRVPFFEYWTGDDNSLGERELTAQIDGLEPGNYSVNVWARVRVKNGEDMETAHGITFSANDGEAVDVTTGVIVGQFRLAKYTAQCVVAEDGLLTVKFTVGADNDISWLSFKNVKYYKLDGTEVSNSQLSADSLFIGAGEQGTLSVRLADAESDWTAYQFLMTLPEGISLVTNEGGEYQYELSARHSASHGLTIQPQADGGYQVVCYSPQSTPLTAATDLLLTLQLKADVSVKGETLQGSLTNISFSDMDGVETALADATFGISVECPIITINNSTREYGEANPTFTYTVTGAALRGEPVLTTTATATSPVTATYPITAERGTIENAYYEVTDGTLTVTKAPLTITVNPAEKKQGDPMPEFTVTYSGFKNGETEAVLTTLPSITCEATAESAPGQYLITADDAEATNYEITYVFDSLTVTPPDIVVVTADDKEREYGDANPDFTYTTEGVALVGTPVLSCDATPTSPVGEYDIVVDKGSVTNLNVELVNGKLTVKKATVTVKVDNMTKPRGTSMPEFTATYSGFKNGETEAVLDKKPAFTCEATPDSPVGTYTITADEAESANYVFVYEFGTLTVVSDVVVVVADKKEREYGEANPELTYTSAGTTLEGEPILTCEATETSPVGNYDIKVSRGTVTNYDASFIDNTLTVTKAPLTITVNAASKVQGDPLPEFTVSYEGFKNGETAETALQTQPLIYCTATADSPQGTYDIIAIGAVAQNYEITYVKGELTIAPIADDVFKYQNMTFKIHSREANEITLIGVENLAYAEVPATIPYDSKEWTVTAVADSAFTSHVKDLLVTVDIPATVTTVEADVFKGCSRLAAIVWRPQVPVTRAMIGTGAGSLNNPNLLFYATSASYAPDGVNNFIDLGTMRAQSITLTDNGSTNDFFCPLTFTADAISYTHDYQQKTQKGYCRGWEALTLPFNVRMITHESKGEITPIKNVTDAQIIAGTKPFWLYEPVSSGWSETDGIQANVPYIISMPNDGSLWKDYILSGKVTFSATNASVPSTHTAQTREGLGGTFHPCYSRDADATALVLNVADAYNNHLEGSVFTSLRTRKTRPFEAYVTTESGVREMGIFDMMADGIHSVESLELSVGSSAEALYDMSGRKIANSPSASGQLHKGIYIVGGKKVLAK